MRAARYTCCFLVPIPDLRQNLNNIIEADHGALKRVIRPTRGFQSMKTAAATLTGFEIMRMIRRGHCIQRERRATGEIRLVNQLFGLAA